MDCPLMSNQIRLMPKLLFASSTSVIFATFVNCLFVEKQITCLSKSFLTLVTYILFLTHMNCLLVLNQIRLMSKLPLTLVACVIFAAFVDCLLVEKQINSLSKFLSANVASVILVSIVNRILVIDSCMLCIVNTQSRTFLPEYSMSKISKLSFHRVKPAVGYTTSVDSKVARADEKPRFLTTLTHRFALWCLGSNVTICRVCCMSTATQHLGSDHHARKSLSYICTVDICRKEIDDHYSLIKHLKYHLSKKQESESSTDSDTSPYPFLEKKNIRRNGFLARECSKITKSAVSRSGRIRTRIRPIQTHHGRTRQLLTVRVVAEATASIFPRADGAEPRQDNPLEQLIGNPLFQAMARAPAVNAVGNCRLPAFWALGPGPVVSPSRGAVQHTPGDERLDEIQHDSHGARPGDDLGGLRHHTRTAGAGQVYDVEGCHRRSPHGLARYPAPQATRHHRAWRQEAIANDILRVRWLDLLPDSTRRLLTIIKNQTIDELAAVADELHAVGPSVMATEVGRPRSRPASPGGAASSNSNSVGAQEIAELRAAIVQLTEITREALQRRDQPRGRSRSRTQPRSQSRPRSPTPHREARPRGTAGTTRDTATWQSSAEARAITIERRLYVTDRTHKIRFLIDSGSVLSILPRTVVRKPLQRKTLELQAANGTTIATYGQHSLTLNLGLRRPFEWAFTIIAGVDVAIIGADLLSHFGLLIDLRNRRLLDKQTSLSTSCQVGPAPQVHTISVAATGVPVGPCVDAYDAILAEFASDKARPGEMATIVDFPVQHRIVTSGQPVFARPRRLAGDRLAAAKARIQRSCSIGASSGLHRASGPVHCTSCRSLEKHLEDHGRLPLAQRPYSTGSTPSAYHRGLASRERRKGLFGRGSVQGVLPDPSQKKTSRRRPSRHLSASSSL
ncbi:unnamed protein product [Trichogramma brassicae]|uniref:C2H2-type domain-containing protein n=1 Tax=Trichogramma brassicae TaxID=86971 RepID=A0A6H5J151_9HYME|nr:unnamed protein product [Trichogramma brassicae]